jgi:hypothetical protein
MRNLLIVCVGLLVVCGSCKKDNGAEVEEAKAVFEDHFDRALLGGSWQAFMNDQDTVYLENNLMVLENRANLSQGPSVWLQNNDYNKSVFTVSFEFKMDPMNSSAYLALGTDSFPTNVLFRVSNGLSIFSIGGNGSSFQLQSNMSAGQWYLMQLGVTNKQQHIIVKEIATGKIIVDKTYQNQEAIKGLWHISTEEFSGIDTVSHKIYIDNFGVY